jgi:CheY-like chemotaxis protein/HPt (histidine-containing phosphotransfer) domain-containing protein
MPGMDGEALGRVIKADQKLRDTRMVVLTSLDSAGKKQLFEKLGFSGHLTKPVRQQELKDILSLALTDPNAGRRLVQSPGKRKAALDFSSTFAAKKKRILLAEDNITNQQVALGMLKKMGLRADAVASGAEAVIAIKSIPYDLVLMDVQMPEMDGLEATRYIRDPKHSIINHDIPIIAMTAEAMQGDREKCLKAGMNDYVSKPVTPRALAEVLAKWLPQAEETDEPEKDLPADTVKEESPPSTESAVWDKGEMMSRMMEDEELVKKVLEMFLEDMPVQIQAIKESMKTGDIRGLEFQTHRIKGSAANVNAAALQAVALAMEKKAKAGDMDAAGAMLADLEKELVRFKNVADKELQ